MMAFRMDGEVLGARLRRNRIWRPDDTESDPSSDAPPCRPPAGSARLAEPVRMHANAVILSAAGQKFSCYRSPGESAPPDEGLLHRMFTP